VGPHPESQRVTKNIRSSFLFYARFTLGFGDFVCLLERKVGVTTNLNFWENLYNLSGARTVAVLISSDKELNFCLVSYVWNRLRMLPLKAKGYKSEKKCPLTGPR